MLPPPPNGDRRWRILTNPTLGVYYLKDADIPLLRPHLNFEKDATEASYYPANLLLHQATSALDQQGITPETRCMLTDLIKEIEELLGVMSLMFVPADSESSDD
ncbi:hypothetical protein IFR05_015696 [Cadophora sp. M221]|nr:hypothetical protein IFR05_016723 [Cadophora sp. M221]KAG4428819.1 hypothetical protein IFR05_015696 [Cadophora sp. M221]